MSHSNLITFCLSHFSFQEVAFWYLGQETPGCSLANSGGAGSTTFPLTVGAFADNTYVLNGRVDELALYKRLLTADERAWLSRNNGQGRAYDDIPAPQLPPDVSLA